MSPRWPRVKFWTEPVAPFTYDNNWQRRRNLVYQNIDNGKFGWWVVFVAGVGFFTDAYDIFAINLVFPMLEYVYWDGKAPPSYKIAMNSATLVGSLLGQVTFGVLADRYGRRKMYGLELIIIITATVGVSMCSTGAQMSMSVLGWLLFWRLVMGVGIGADYPLSAVITSEFAPKQHRARMMALLFFMQPIGYLAAALTSIIAVRSFKDSILSGHDNTKCTSNDCIRAVDSAWRWVIGFGAVPAAVAVLFRLTIPESPRYTLDVENDSKKAHHHTVRYFDAESDVQLRNLARRTPGLESGQAPGRAETESLHANPPYQDHNARDHHHYTGGNADHSEDNRNLGVPMFQNHLTGSPTQNSSNNTTAVGEVPGADEFRLSSPSRSPHNRPASPAANSTNLAEGDPIIPPHDEDPRPPKASKADLIAYFYTAGNWRYVLGTSGTWLLLDFAFYGLSSNSPSILSRIFPEPSNTTVYTSLLTHGTHTLIVTSIGTLLGGALMIKAVKHFSRKKIQMFSFLVLAGLLFVAGATFMKLIGGQFRGVFLLLYILCQLFFNLGPNATTFIIPAEMFPTRYRCTCHGIAAASGKLGSVLAQVFFVNVVGSSNSDNSTGNSSSNNNTRVGIVLHVFAAFMLAGAALTYFWVPETCDDRGQSLKMEELVEGRRYFLSRQAEEGGGRSG